MKVLSITELLCLTRAELIELERHLRRQLTELRIGSPEHSDSAATLANVRTVLARPELTARRLAPGAAP